MTPRAGPGALLLVLLAFAVPAIAQPTAAAGAPDATDAADADTALAEGNRRFGDGDLAGAMRAYGAGWARGGDSVLAYNLGVAAQRLGRLPEAVLWYRRAESDLGDDLWLRDNLELARSALGAPAGPRPAWAGWVERRSSLVLLGITLAWLLPLLAARPGRGPALAVAALAFLCFSAGTFLGRLGPRAAVLLADCPVAGGRPLPAGTEVWVSREAAGWRVTGGDEAPLCPPEAVALVDE